MRVLGRPAVALTMMAGIATPNAGETQVAGYQPY
jgi:ABC-type uncharacterized transport system ATPase subunit